MTIDAPAVYRDYLSICFVRNPWARAYSAFLYSKRMTEAGETNGQAPRLYLEKRPDADFGAFVADFLKTADVSRILHFREQSHWILRGQPQFIGRVERLKEDVAVLARFLGGPVELARLNAAPQAERLQDVYDATSRETIGAIYRRDARFLNYRFPAEHG